MWSHPRKTVKLKQNKTFFSLEEPLLVLGSTQLSSSSVTITGQDEQGGSHQTSVHLSVTNNVNTVVSSQSADNLVHLVHF